MRYMILTVFYLFFNFFQPIFALLQADVSFVQILDKYGLPTLISVVLLIMLSRAEQAKISLMKDTNEQMEKNNQFLQKLVENNKCNFK